LSASRLLFWAAAALIVGLDQWTKHLARVHLADGLAHPLLPGVLWLRLVHNRGVAFGHFDGAGPVLVILAAAAAVAIVLFRRAALRRSPRLSPLLEFGLSLPLGGAIGNGIDRLLMGRVTDFFDLGWFPVFNVADSAITVGGVLLALHLLSGAHPEPAAPVTPSQVDPAPWPPDEPGAGSQPKSPVPSTPSTSSSSSAPSILD